MARKTTSATQKIMAYMERNPDAKPAQVAKALKVPVLRVYSVRVKMKEVKAEQRSFEQVIELYQRGVDRLPQPAPPKNLTYYMNKLFGWFK